MSGTTSHYCNDYSNKICDKLKATQTFKTYSLLFYFVSSSFFIQTSTISRVHSCTAKKHSYASHAFVFSIFKKNTYCLCPSVRPSCRPSVSMSFCGNLISNRLIDPKIGLNVGYEVVHV